MLKVLVICAAAALGMSSCTGSHEPDSAGTRHGISDAELDRASVAVRQEVEAADATLTSATVSTRLGKVADSNTGHSCTSGRVLDVRLSGSFPRVTTTGTPGQSDTTIRGMLLTVDAASGDLCLIGVTTETPRIAPGSEAIAWQ